MLYPSGKQPKLMTLQDIYEELQKKSIKSVSIKGKVVTAKDIKEVTGVYHPKAVMFMFEDWADVMIGEDYKSIDTINMAIGSICRLDKASGIHICLGTSRADNGVLSTDLQNNLPFRLLLGNFNKDTSMCVFEQDISNKCKPNIKGRGFIGYDNKIAETQIFEGKTTHF